MGSDVAEAVLDIALTLLPYEIKREDRDKISDDLKRIIESFKGLENAFFGVPKGE